MVTLEVTKVLGSEFIQEVLVKRRDGLDKCKEKEITHLESQVFAEARY